ncbi:MAG: hypothetical protein KatS3mg027_0845 [Bacteroidia bacterium]|nr:MAG: hypothetical protein KatS3mg027_0845 [Bacteroidia bacterium]
MNTFQDFFHTSGGGYFVFPLKQVKTNSPYYFRTYSDGKWRVNKCTKIVDSLWYIGMCGISAVTDTSCFLSIKNEWKKLDGFTRIKVFCRKNKSFELQPGFKFSKIIERDGYTEFILHQKLDSIGFYIHKKDTISSEFILDGISCENDSAGLYYAGFGVNGATSESFLKCRLLLHQIRNINVDLFILSFGVNDVRNKDFSKNEYISHYDSLISILKRTHPESSILLTTISDNYIKRRYVNPRTQKGNEAIWEIMKKYQLAVWDLNAVMGGQKSMLKWHKNGYAAKDKIHFNRKGYTILGEMMVQAILERIIKKHE